ncbi:hypothetical protein [Calothrix rhizosoleniae]|uniref:hypothetical protein n=1 Tax=Calothrix rhizosoleniae TaxID=888997 RepID=UPI001178B9CD
MDFPIKANHIGFATRVLPSDFKRSTSTTDIGYDGDLRKCKSYQKRIFSFPSFKSSKMKQEENPELNQLNLVQFG